MKVDIQQQWKLLDLQKLDTRLDQIRHRTANQPQAKQLAELKKRADAAAEESVLADTAVQDAEREVKRAEGDLSQVTARLERNNSRLEAGGNPRELSALQHENASLERRRGVLEESQLEIMERVGELKTRAEKFRAVLDEAESSVRQLKDEMAKEVRDLQQEAEEVRAQREQAAGGIGADLLSEYERIRATSGVAAGQLYGRRCTGCGMELNQRDLARIRAAAMDELLYCEECGRILVRMPETDSAA